MKHSRGVSQEVLRRSSLVLVQAWFLGQVPGRGDSESIKSEGEWGLDFFVSSGQIRL